MPITLAGSPDPIGGGSVYSAAGLNYLSDANRLRSLTLAGGNELLARGALGAAENANRLRATSIDSENRYAANQDELAFGRQKLAEDARQNTEQLQAADRQIQLRAEAQAWVNSRELTERERIEMDRMNNTVSEINMRQDIPEEVKADLITQYRTKLSPFEARMQQSHARLYAEQAETAQNEAKLRSELVGKDGLFMVKNLDKFTRVIEDPNGSGRKILSRFNPLKREWEDMQFDPKGEGRDRTEMTFSDARTLRRDIRKEVMEDYTFNTGNKTADEVEKEIDRRFQYETKSLSNLFGGVRNSAPGAELPVGKAFNWDDPKDREAQPPEVKGRATAWDNRFTAAANSPLPAAVKSEVLGLIRRRQEIIARGGGGVRPEDRAAAADIDKRLREIEKANPAPGAAQPTPAPAPPRTPESQRMYDAMSRRGL